MWERGKLYELSHEAKFLTARGEPRVLDKGQVLRVVSPWPPTSQVYNDDGYVIFEDVDVQRRQSLYVLASEIEGATIEHKPIERTIEATSFRRDDGLTCFRSFESEYCPDGWIIKDAGPRGGAIVWFWSFETREWLLARGLSKQEVEFHCARELPFVLDEMKTIKMKER